MGTYLTMSGHGAEVTSAYRKIEVAYHELQAAQIHLRSLHARTMHARPRSQDLLRQELTRISERAERATAAYRKAMDDYIRVISRSGDRKADAAPPSRQASSASGMPFLAGLRP